MEKIKVLLCYALEDKSLRNELEKHLKILDRDGFIDLWDDHNISAGVEWESEIDTQLKAAQIILLLISPDFIHTNHCYDIEMKKALQQHKLGKACVIPVILRRVMLETTPLAKLQILPQNAEPVTSKAWHTLDEAFHNVATGVREIVMRLVKEQGLSAGQDKQDNVVDLAKNSQAVYAPLPLLDVKTNKNRNSARKSNLRFRFVLVLIILVSIFSIWLGIDIYQNDVNHLMTQMNKTATAVANIATSQAKGTATGQANETQTTSCPSYLSRCGTLAFADPLSQKDRWSPGTNSSGAECQFTEGTYHVSEQHNGFMDCHANETFSNFAFEVQLTITQGDCGGMTFRVDGNGHFYYFQICQDGTYDVARFVSDSGSDTHDLHFSQSSAIHTGLGQPNKIAVVALGSAMTFYVNEQQIDQEEDSSYTSGSIGLIAASLYPTGNATDVAYSNARVWTL